MSTWELQSSAAAVDGYVDRAAVNESWTVISTSSGNGALDSGSGFSMLIAEGLVSNEWTTLRRGVFLFDPTPLPPGAIISAASIKFYPNALGARNFGSSFVITAAPVADPTSLAVTDYQLLEAAWEEYSDTRHTLASLTAGVYFSYDLNAVGYAAFQTAYDAGTPFGVALVFDWDFDGASPTWLGGSLTDNITIMCVEAGSAKWPVLSLTYRVGKGYATVQLTTTLVNGADTATADLWAVELFT